MNIANLCVNIGRGQRFGWRIKNIFKTLTHQLEQKSDAYGNRLFIFLLLFVNNTKSKVDLIALAMTRVDVENVGKRFFSMIE